MKNIYPWQDDDWRRLQELNKRPLHGLLFKGARGIGKLDMAMNFAQSLLCPHQDEKGFACGKCPSCHWFSLGSHPDFCLLQPEALGVEGMDSDEGKPASTKKPSKQISVDQIRKLDDFTGMSSHQGGRRVVLINPAETMNANAANALLKKLEEPPPGLLFILVAQKPQQLLATILSRCLPFALSAPDSASAIRWLTQQGVKDPGVTLAACGFSPLQAAHAQIGSEERSKLLRALRQPATLDVFAMTEALQKTEQPLVVQWLQQWSHDLNSMKMAGRLRYHPGEEDIVRKLVEPVSPLNLARLQNCLLNARRDARHTLNSKLFFESLLLLYRQLLLEHNHALR